MHKEFYVNDALTYVCTVEEVVNYMKETRTVLQSNGKIHLHTIASYSIDVMKEFPMEGLGKDLKDSNLNADTLHVNLSLRITWDKTMTILCSRSLMQRNP